MVEIYNEQVRDLLSNDIAQKRYPSPSNNKTCLLSVRISLMIAFSVLTVVRHAQKKHVVLDKKKHSEFGVRLSLMDLLSLMQVYIQSNQRRMC